MRVAHTEHMRKPEIKKDNHLSIGRIGGHKSFMFGFCETKKKKRSYFLLKHANRERY